MSVWTVGSGSVISNVEAERAILGAVLLDNQAFSEAAEVLVPEDFALDSHRRIYRRMMDLSERAAPIDMLTLVNELEAQKDLQSVGDVSYISSLLDGVPDRPSIAIYVGMVRDKARLRGACHVADLMLVQAMDGRETADTVIAGAESGLFELTERRIGKGFRTVKEVVLDSFGSIDDMLNRGAPITGVATHFLGLDAATCGLQKAELTILAARPSMGKTALAMNITENAAYLDRKVVAVFSLEMSADGLAQRLFCSRGEVNLQRFRKGDLNEQEKRQIAKAADEIASCGIHIDDTAGLAVSEMRAKARRLKQKHGLDLIVIDYLQLMSGGSKSFENRTQEVSAITRGLKGLAKELDVPVLALSQLSRETEKRENSRPRLSDLRDSGSIEQDADVVLFIYREEVYKPLVIEVSGTAEIIIAKQRNGPIATVSLAFEGVKAKFSNFATG
jgi:replicative DNA helicase